MQRSLDSFDRKLLGLVQRDADRTCEDLAEHVGLSASAVQRRLKRLKAEGVITSTIMTVNPERVGRPSFFVVGLEVERERPELLARLRSWLSAEDAVQEVFYVTGTTDYVLIIAAPDVGAYDELMSRLIADNSNVRRFTTNVAMTIHKRQLLIPISAEAKDG